MKYYLSRLNTPSEYSIAYPCSEVGFYPSTRCTCIRKPFIRTINLAIENTDKVRDVATKEHLLFFSLFSITDVLLNSCFFSSLFQFSFWGNAM